MQLFARNQQRGDSWCDQCCVWWPATSMEPLAYTPPRPAPGLRLCPSAAADASRWRKACFPACLAEPCLASHHSRSNVPPIVGGARERVPRGAGTHCSEMPCTTWSWTDHTRPAAPRGTCGHCRVAGRCRWTELLRRHLSIGSMRLRVRRTVVPVTDHRRGAKALRRRRRAPVLDGPSRCSKSSGLSPVRSPYHASDQ